uniref:Uncharacterized protein n=1 Tax=Nelumbo nucifera TaxID=4432 RepID=A0A822XM25_NELNU|nr:TPA_asm: hypothetical protein HUJ06_022535 [Nelumbo nucifera]
MVILISISSCFLQSFDLVHSSLYDKVFDREVFTSFKWNWYFPLKKHRVVLIS